MQAVAALERALFVSLVATYLFGYRAVLEELRHLRESRGDRPMLIGEDMAGAPRAVEPALRAITTHARGRAVVLMTAAWDREKKNDDLLLETLMRLRGRRIAHVLAIEYVSRALNGGRSLAAIGEVRPAILAAQPALWAMRSEQLDQNTCEPCESLHGEIAEVASDRYYLLLPPNGCITASIASIGPRCRGVMVYGDLLEDFLRG